MEFGTEENSVIRIVSTTAKAVVETGRIKI
jgi:hypothetical protein